MFFISRRFLAHACVSIGLSILCCAATPPESSPETPVWRVTPSGGLFSIEFPSEPTCDSNQGSPDCLYEDPKVGWILRVSYWKIDDASEPAEHLLNHLGRSAEEGGFRIDRKEATHVGEYPALDYRLESINESAYRSAGRLVLIGTQFVDIEVGGDTLPSEDVLQGFVSSFRVERPPSKPSQPAVPSTPAPVVPSTPALVVPSTPAPAVPSTPAPAVPSTPAPAVEPATIARVQAKLLKLGPLQYQNVQEKLPGDGMPWRFTVGTVQRITQRIKRDNKRNAFVIKETGRTPAGKVENVFWVDAKTLLPYRGMSRSPGSSMSWELINGSVRGEIKGSVRGGIKGAIAKKFDKPVGDTPLLFPGAPLELALSTLPLEQGFTGSIQVLDPGGWDTGKLFSTWQLSVPYAGPVSGLANLKKEVASYKVELIERTEEKDARRINLWIENAKVRRVLQVEALAPASRGGDRTVQMIQAQR